MRATVIELPRPSSTREISAFPFLDLKAQFAGIKDEILAAVHEVLDSQRFILGPEIEALETEIAARVGSRFAVSCASGSDALLLAMMALEIDSGDEVITTPFTFAATAGSIARLKAKPVFVDIDPATCNLDVRKLEAAITKHTRAIMPVHLFGLTAEMNAILDIAAVHRLAVIEDAAQAIGATYNGRAAGNLGTFGCFSFFPSKNLGGAGDGGMVTTSDPRLAARLNLLRVHGSPRKYEYELLGFNSRLDALQAAILRVKLRHLDDWTAARRRNAARYRQLFHEYNLEHWITLPCVPPHCEHVYNQFVIRTRDRDPLREHLRRNGIPTEVYYPYPLHLQPAFAFLGHKPGDFPQSEVVSKEVLALPIYPELAESQQRAVVKAIASFHPLSTNE